MHRWCNYYDRDCHNKANGHRDEATKENRMGGSTRNLNINEWLFGQKNKCIVKKKLYQCNSSSTVSLNYYEAQSTTSKSELILIEADTGIIEHYFRTQDRKVLQKIRKTHNQFGQLCNDYCIVVVKK